VKRYAVVLLVLVASGACGPRGQDPVAGEEHLAMEADQVMFQVRHYMTSGGVRRALVEADTAYLYEATSLVDLRTVHVIVYDDQGQERGTLTSRTGRLNTRTEAMTAQGNAVLITRAGNRRIESEELHFDPQQDRIWSDLPTTMHEDGNVIRGEGFTSDAQMQNVRVIRPTGRFDDLRIEF
jgi:LPS export ABC transporter protein LptC